MTILFTEADLVEAVFVLDGVGKGGPGGRGGEVLQGVDCLSLSCNVAFVSANKRNEETFLDSSVRPSVPYFRGNCQLPEQICIFGALFLIAEWLQTMLKSQRNVSNTVTTKKSRRFK